MKLKHLLFGSMIALAFTACSEKDTLPEEPDVKVKTTSLSLKLDPFTRAEGANIASLYVVVANAEGNIEAIDDADTQELLDQISVVDIELSAGAKQVVVFANLPEDDVIDAYPIGTPLENMLAETAKLAFNTHEGEPTAGDELLFTMSSKVHDITIYEGESHYLGFPNATGDGEVYYNANGEDDTPVRLYRNVAKVVVSDITLGTVYVERSGLGLETRTELLNPAFTINEIAVVQSMAESKLAGADFGEWASTFVEGSTSYVSGYPTDEYTGFEEEEGDNFVKITGETAVIEGNDLYRTTYDEAIDADDYATETNPVREFFVYENPNTNVANEILTLVTVKGTISGDIWTDTNGDEVQDADELQFLSIENRYYTVAVGVTGFGEEGFDIEGDVYQDIDRSTDGVYLGVFRNLQYNITMNLTGRGSPSPFDIDEEGSLDVKAVVVPWGTVTQNTGVE